MALKPRLNMAPIIDHNDNLEMITYSLDLIVHVIRICTCYNKFGYQWQCFMYKDIFQAVINLLITEINAKAKGFEFKFYKD